ncbi:MAG: hypothetical protein CMF61_04470 [Magnetococcales bacterium]|nr:hypothetical protein [Magnetococcales bacterium]
MVNLKKFSAVFVGALAVVALTACCDSSQGSNQNAQMQHFKYVEGMQSHYYEMVRDGNIVMSVTYRYIANSSRVADYYMSVVFAPVPMVILRGDNNDVHQFYYLDSPNTPESLKAFWQVMYERAAEDSVTMGYTMAEPLVSVDTQSLADFEAEIEALKSDIESYKAALEEAKNQLVDLGKTVDTLTASLAKAEANLVEVTKQRDAYKQAFEKFKSSIPSFE